MFLIHVDHNDVKAWDWEQQQPKILFTTDLNNVYKKRNKLKVVGNKEKSIN